MKQLTLKKITSVGLGMLLLVVGNTPANSAASPVKPVSSNPVQFTISLGAELMAGDTTYKIGDPSTGPSGITENDYFPFSELKWPLDIWMAKIEGNLVIKDRWRINASLKKNISDPSDNMADSDWITLGNPSQLDVYSESEISSFDALIFDVNAEWVFLKHEIVSLYAGLGLLYQNFDYDSELLYQYSPSGRSGWNFTGNGEVSITYEMTYTIPYVKFGADFQISPKFGLGGSLSFSPIVSAKDTDNHLLRENGGKISTGDMDGNALMIDFSGKYMFTPALFVKAGVQYLKIDVDGTQTQKYGNGAPGYTVTQEAESTQTTSFIAVGYQF